jgi:uncharacterized membrane protein YdjX (TVP38/TMEM64 family)
MHHGVGSPKVDTARGATPQGCGPSIPASLPRRTTTRIWVAVCVVLLAVAYPEIRRVSPLVFAISLQHIHIPIAEWGPWAPIGSVLIMVANTFVPFPGESLGIVNGAIFGFWGGLAVSWTGVMGSAVIAFGMGRALSRRTLGRGRVQELVVYADALVRRGWQIALVVRFFPLFPFALFNFALGRAPVPWGTFLWTTAFGVFPMTAAFVAVGYGAAAVPGMVVWATPALAGFIAAGFALRSRMGRDPRQVQ